jgi:hypothetical protein
MPRLPLPTVFRRACGLIPVAAALSCVAPAWAAPSPAEGASPAAAPARIRPLAGVLLTGTLSSDNEEITNPDGTTATGSLSGRYEAFAGAEFPVDVNGMSIRLTGGIHVATSMSSSHGSEHFTRFPLEATLWYALSDKLRIGAGARYSMRARFSGAGRNTSDGLTATPGVILGLGYQLLPHLLVDGRYVYERYEQASGADLEASHWGLGLTAIY